MKTEKEFSEIFLDSSRSEGKNRGFVEDVATRYWIDLTSHLNGYFSHEDQLAITQKAARELDAQLKIKSPEEAWKSVIRDFSATGNWGFVSQDRKPVTEKTEDQKIFWKFFKYTWALFQAMVLVKIAILFFGLRSAQNPNSVNQIWVWIVCAISLASLGYFAWRNREDKD